MRVAHVDVSSLVVLGSLWGLWIRSGFGTGSGYLSLISRSGSVLGQQLSRNKTVRHGRRWTVSSRV